MNKIPDPETVATLLRESLSQGSQPRLRVTSSSMAPTLRVGDHVMIEKVRPDDLRLGDILVIQRQEDLLTHRLVAQIQSGWHTKGDQEAIPDPPCPPELILGRVNSIERGCHRISLKKNSWRIINPILGKLSWWEAKLYQIAPSARLPIRLITRIILWLMNRKGF